MNFITPILNAVRRCTIEIITAKMSTKSPVCPAALQFAMPEAATSGDRLNCGSFRRRKSLVLEADFLSNNTASSNSI
jgi:hypothetical protein